MEIFVSLKLASPKSQKFFGEKIRGQAVSKFDVKYFLRTIVVKRSQRSRLERGKGKTQIELA
jgi:hypothetical protein